MLDAETIKSQSMKHFEQLSYLVPNLNLRLVTPELDIFKLEELVKDLGIKERPNSSVGFLIDDIDYSGQGGIATTFDVEQIEIHRGPQGSRIGANALAGLIYIRTKDPTDVF